MFRHTWVFTKQTWLAFNRDNCTQQAAAISYYVLFSLLPLALLTVSVIGFVLTSESRRADLVDEILSRIPLSQTEGRDAVEKALDSVQRVSGPIAALGLAITLWTSSAVFAAIRKALNVVWGVDEHRPWAQAKLIDFAQVGVLSAILLSSVVATAVIRIVREISADHFGPLANTGSPLWEIPPVVLPAVLSLITFGLLYRIVPATRPRWRDIIPGALFAMVLFELMKNLFAFYVANFNNFDVVYGSLAGVFLFLLFTFIASSILLAGAELARTFERYHRGELQDELYPPVPQPSIAEQAIRAVRGLFVRQ